jgi:signal transduction histidine kinase/DNA-binding response OmpR family regulator
MDYAAEHVNLLLVNDRPAQLMAWQSILAGLDVNLVLAQSGVEALEHLLSTEFAAILLDVQMPTMDGFETATLIRQRPRSQHVPILFVTAINTQERDRARGYALGAVDYIFTPLVPEILRAKVVVFADLHRKAQQVARQAAELSELNAVLGVQLDEIRHLNEDLTRANAELQTETAERRRAESKLRRAHAKLEERVQKRTVELAQANADLKHEIAERRQADEALRLSSDAERMARRAAEQNAERAAREQERLARLQAATAALSQAVTPEEVALVTVQQAALALNLSVSALSLLSADGQVLELAQAVGYLDPALEAMRRVSLAAAGPAAEAVRSRTSIWLEDRAAFEARYGHLSPGALAGQEALLAIPLLLDERALGVVWLTGAERRPFSASDMELLMTLGQQCALALERARLYGEAQAANTQLEARVAARTGELLTANAQLAQSRVDLRRLSGHLEKLREEERARIAREVHDELGGALTAIKMDVVRLGRGLAHSSDTAPALLDGLMQTIDGTIKTVRRIATELRPALLDDFGLVAALEWQLQEFGQRAGLNVQFHTNREQLDLNQDTSIALFRVFQETLTNIARHAQASAIEVTLEAQTDSLVLRVSDNGRGIDLNELAGNKSFGLVSMRERVQLLSGGLDISGLPGRGTTVLVRIPLKNSLNGHGLQETAGYH